jgi:hypothetical protein
MYLTKDMLADDKDLLLAEDNFGPLWNLSGLRTNSVQFQGLLH